MSEESQQGELFEPGSGYFSTPGRNGLLQQLSYLLQFGEGLPVVEGEPGSGKSVLASELASWMGSSATVVEVLFEQGADLDQFLTKVASELGIPFEGEKSRGELLALVRRYSQDLNASQSLAVVVVDNAENLDSASLGALLSLLQGEAEAGSGLRMVFFSEPGLVDKLDELQLLDVAVYDFDIPLLSPAELSQFFSHISDKPNLAEDAVKLVWNLSKGNPGKALKLIEKPAEEVKVKRLKLPIWHAAALALLLVALVWALLVRKPSSDSSDLDAENRMPKQITDGKPLDVAVGGQEITVVPTTLTPAPSFAPVVAVADRKRDEPEGYSSGIGGVNIVTPEPESENSQVVSNAILPESPSPTPTVIITPEPAVTPVPTLAVTLVPTLEPTSAPSPTLLESPTPIPTIAPTVELRSPGGIETHEVFLLAQPEFSYVIQVLSASKHESLASYLSRQSNRENLYLYTAHKNGAKRYVVLAGIYENRAKALATVKTLPKEQQKAGPWVRPISAIHSEIKAFRSN